jgi:adenine/guanine/hypoxanthine permease
MDALPWLCKDPSVDKTQGAYSCMLSVLTESQPQQIRGTSLFRELRAGLTTFATMAYIIAVNVSQILATTLGKIDDTKGRLTLHIIQSQVLSDTGGTCPCDDTVTRCKDDADYLMCQIS